MPKRKVHVRAPYNYDADEASQTTGLVCPEPTLTQQHQEEEANINTIVRRFGVTGQLPNLPVPPTYADFEDVFDFHSAQNLIRQAQESFNALPAEVRHRFNHDPAAFLEFVDTPGNEAELARLGLRKPTVDPSAAPSEAPAPSSGATGATEAPKG